MFVPEVASNFQSKGITALIYDLRTLGASDGLPRNQVNPMMQVSDYSDALTFMRTLRIVDPENIVFWRQFFSGYIALCAASLNQRAKISISISPVFN